ncbi:MAG: hypothetical protein KC546_11005 [Anaerolineae bacterium]|nr:hypothetical protein [Anaerolineae bacterium]MCA9888895.1 hypothetical protein [Anaerolineae bacterium]MCA9892459.1 hypothetical protein [Anaerolineae bacterium]MCB9460367.1 hypothetical protein [Anaerolineaceae bacterium]
MSPDILKAFFRMGVFVAGTSGLLLFLVKRDSAEFVITVLSLCVGLTLLGLVSLVIWYTNNHG